MLLSQPIISLFRNPGTYKASQCTSARFGAERRNCAFTDRRLGRGTQ